MQVGAVILAWDTALLPAPNFSSDAVADPYSMMCLFRQLIG
jgi:hypothetical protein